MSHSHKTIVDQLRQLVGTSSVSSTDPSWDQGNRPVIVKVFDELVRTLSKGVHYRKLEMAGGNLKVMGSAESNNRISSLMRNLDESPWFAAPNLRTIKEDPKNSDYGPQASTFDLTFVQVSPNQDDDKGPGE